MTSNNLPFNPYNDKFNLEQNILRLPTKFNKMIYFSNKATNLTKQYDENMKKLSENSFLYYFNKIRIYYLNFKRSETQLKYNIDNFKIDRIKYIYKQTIKIKKK